MLTGAVTIIIAVWAYRVGVDRPGAIGPLGFFGWYDQREYLQLTKTLLSGHLPAGPADYTYGLGYPVIGVPFAALGRADPYIVPDLLMAAAAIIASSAVAVRLIGRRGAAFVVALLIVATPLIALTIVPWSSMVTVVAVAVGFAVATAPTPLTRGRALALGVLTGAVFAARYVDVVVLGAILVWCWAAAWRGPRRWVVIFWSAVPAALIGGLVLLSQAVVLGSPFTTPYATHFRPDGTSDQSLSHFHISAIFVHFWETFVSGQAAGVPTGFSPLLVISPFLVLFPIGAFLVVRRGGLRSFHIMALATSVVMSAVYLSFVAGGGSDLPYRNYRYWIAFYPYWTILSVLVFQRAGGWLAARIRSTRSAESTDRIGS